MDLGFDEARAGNKRTAAVCPNCGSEEARLSRRHYDGVWTLLFRVRPAKCEICGLYFPINADDHSSWAGPDRPDRGLPFRPFELDQSAERAARPPSKASPAETLGLRIQKGCPRCGSGDAKLVVRGEHESPVSRLDPRDPYRCPRCNAAFRRTNIVRLVTLVGVLVILLAGLTNLGLLGVSRIRRNQAAPIMKRDTAPKDAPPPVFR